MSHTVVCALCQNEHNRRCARKNNKVKINKPRHCDLYVESVDKRDILESKKANKPQTVLRPDWYWDKKNYIKELRKQVNEETVKVPNSVEPGKTRVVPVPTTGDMRFPLTGDLSRFISSVDAPDQKNN